MRAVAFLVSALVTGGVAMAADEAPNWMREAAAQKTPPYPSKVPAVVLLNDETVSVEENGRVTTTVRRAIKVLTREGRKDARGLVDYDIRSRKVRDFRAWTIRPSGETKKYAKDNIMDIVLAPNDVYNEVRARAVSAENDADPGAVFGYESVTERQSVFTQFEYSFQDRLPVLISRFALTLPPGWKPNAVVFNGNAEMQSSGSTYTWERRDLPFIDEEPSSPSMAALALRIAVSYIPADNARPMMGRVFKGWPDVAQWLAELEDPQAVPDEDISQKTRALTQGMDNEFDRIRAIGHYVQAVHYVSIQTGLGRGGGYKPHAATEVFRKQYGDCKDKANLMRTMLKVAGIQAWPVSIYSGDPTFVRESWPSPHQFNHAIIAVKVADSTTSPSIATVPRLGRLLFFDPTDENTPVGDLPEHEQGSLALIDDTTAGALVHMPVIPPASNRVERKTEIVLSNDGGIAATVQEQSFGQNASSMRYRLRSRGNGEFSKSIERWIASGANGAALGKVDINDVYKDNRFELGVQFTAGRYAQMMQGRLMLFRPAVLPRRNTVLFSEPKRQNPVVLQPQFFEETVQVNLPSEFKIDELPQGGKLDSPFGTFSVSYTAKDGTLEFKRKLEIRPATVPANQYSELKTFFEKVAGSEQAPVVLVK